jgi:hypothetical protein
MSDSTYKWAAALLLCTTIASGAGALYLNNRVNALETEYERTLNELKEFTATVDIKIEYGNGTVAWFNGTRIGAGEFLMNATLRVAKMDYTMYGFGVFVNTLNGVGGDPDKYWLWSYYDNGWQSGMVGADQWRLHDGDAVAWTYAGFS